MAVLVPDLTHRPTRTTDRSIDVVHFAAIADGDTYTTPMSSAILFAVFEPEASGVTHGITISAKTVTIRVSGACAGRLMIIAEGA